MHQRRPALPLAALLTLFWGGGAAESPEGKTSPQRLALLVGIDKYRNVTNLTGCVNDVENMKSLLTTKFEFSEENVLVLKNESATRKAILDAFQSHLIARARPGDIVVIHYSGHGSQMKDTSADETDGLDETIVPHDSREGMVFDISDDELNGLLDRLAQKTHNITFILDSCHSGTGTRAAGLARVAPPDPRPPRDPERFAVSVRGVDGKSDVRPADGKYVLLAGCRSKEVSFEYQAEGRSYGALTYFLAQELRAAGAGTTYRDVMDKVMGRVSAAYPAQHPQLEGAKAENYVFSDASSIAAPYVLVSPKQGGVELKAGEVQGLTKGSLYDVYGPTTKRLSDPEKPVARVELTKVEPYTAEARVTSGGPVLEASRAVERKHEYSDRRLIVHYLDLDKSVTLRSIKAELDKLKFIVAAPQATGYQLLLREDRVRKAIVTEGGDPSEISPPVSLDDSDVVPQVVDQIQQWAKWFNVLSIESRTLTHNVKVTIQVVEDGQSRSPFRHEDQADVVLEEGDEFELVVKNTAGRDLYLAVLDLESTGAISQVFPEVGGAGEILPTGASWKRRLRTTLPVGRDSIRDALKVFATVSPLDFRPLTLPPVRGGETGRAASQHPLNQLIENAATGVARGTMRIDSDSWVSVTRFIEIRKKKTS